MEYPRSGGGAALAAGVLAVLCGCGLLLALGAPPRMPLMNLAALLVGLVAAAVARLVQRADRRVADWLLLAAGLALPLTAVLGPEANGVSRWVVVAGLTLQPGLILVPLIVMGVVSRPGKLRIAAVALAALGTALQPDAGTAAMLVAGIGAAAAASRSARLFIALLPALAGAAVALARPVALPPVPFVEQVLEAAFDAGAATAMLALAGVALMFLPSLVTREVAAPAARAAFAGVWAGGLLAALLAPYPTPVIGFGGSAVLGYVLSLAVLASRPRTFSETDGSSAAAPDCQSGSLA